MLDKKLKKTGTILMHNGEIHIDGFEADDCMCREVAILSLLWAVTEIQNEIVALVSKPGGNISGMDLPLEVGLALNLPDYDLYKDKLNGPQTRI